MKERGERIFLFMVFGFPPRAGSGVQRAVRFTQILPQHGWKPIVLTIPRWGNDLVDETWEEGLPPETKIYRILSLDPFRIYQALCRKNRNSIEGGRKEASPPEESPLLKFLRKLYFGISVPDHAIWWVPTAVIAGLCLILKHRPKLLFSTAGPYGAAIAGLILHRLSGLPWVAEYRDPWVENSMRDFPPLRRKIETALEQTCLKHATAVVATTEPVLAGFRRKSPSSKRSIFAVVSNGFDLEAFKQFSETERDDVFRIVYTGMFYDRQTPDHFFHGVMEACRRRPEVRQKLRVIIAGTMPGKSLAIARQKPLDEMVEILGYVSHREVLRLLARADALYLALPAEDIAFTGAKLSEYLAARKFIFALVPPEGIAAQIIRRFEAGMVVPPEDVPAIADALINMFERFRAGELRVKHSLEDLREFSWQYQVKKLANVFEAISLEKKR